MKIKKYIIKLHLFKTTTTRCEISNQKHIQGVVLANSSGIRLQATVVHSNTTPYDLCSACIYKTTHNVETTAKWKFDQTTSQL